MSIFLLTLLALGWVTTMIFALAGIYKVTDDFNIPTGWSVAITGALVLIFSLTAAASFYPVIHHLV